MPRSFFKIIFLFFFYSCAIRCSAQTSPLVGSMISYEALSDDLYQINAVLYRDCKGVALPNKITLTISTDSSHTTTIFAKLAKVESAEKLCPGVNPCSPSNTQVSAKGVEKLTYTAQIDLTQSPYATWKTAGKCQFYFTYINYSRSQDITTGIYGPHFNYAMLDVCNLAKTANPKQNTSPKLGFEPPFYVCHNYSLIFNLGITDTIDKDSFSTRRSNPLGLNQFDELAYMHPNSIDYPIIPYCLFGSGFPCEPIPNANPPVGVYFMPECNQVFLTPTQNNEISVLAFEITEWRKDNFGNNYLIGISRLDFMISVTTCDQNNPPILTGTFDITIGEGDSINYIINSKDKPVFNPPPIPNQKPDTTFLAWNHAIKGATFTIIDTNLRERKGKFVWNDTKGKARVEPYKFSVQVWDQACPRPSMASRCFNVTVQRKASAQRHYSQYLKLCDLLTLDATINADFLGAPAYSWKVYTLKDSFIFQSNKKTDTLHLSKNALYKIVFSVYGPSDYLVTYTDTFNYNVQNNKALTIKDSVFSCENKNNQYLDTLFEPNVFGGKWYYIDVNKPLGRYEMRYVVSNKFCTVSDTGLLFTWAAPKINLGNDTTLYKGESLLLTISTQGNNLWDNGSTANTRLIEESKENAGNKTVWASVINNHPCTATDSINVFINKTNRPVSIHHLEPFFIGIRPNPANQFIEVISNCNRCEGYIYNSIGEKMRSFSIANKSQLIDISQLPKGLYFLNMSNTNEIKYTTFIKE